MSVMPELEAMARTICRAGLPYSDLERVDRIVRRTWESFLPEARAALMAIRNHDTSEFLDAITAPLMPYANQLLPGSAAVSVWQAGIDHILAEPKTPEII